MVSFLLVDSVGNRKTDKVSITAVDEMKFKAEQFARDANLVDTTLNQLRI